MIFLAGAAGDLRIVQGRGSGLLDGDELARVAVVLHVGEGADDPLVAADPAQPPADHVPALGERVDLDAHLPAPGTSRKLSGLAGNRACRWAASWTTISSFAKAKSITRR